MNLNEAIDYLEYALSDKKDYEGLSGHKYSLYDSCFRGNPKLEQAVRVLLKFVDDC